VRASSVIRATAWAAVAAGVAVPLLRRRTRIPPPVVTAAAAMAPIALCVAVPRSHKRDVATCALQMWAYTATYQMPNDDPEALKARVHVTYPVKVDRVLGFGKLPSLRLQNRLAKPGDIRRADKVLVWVHWLWFAVPHGTAAYILIRKRHQFPKAALMTYAVFDLGLIGYWAVPTAPPWYAAEQGAMGDPDPALRRMMVEHGERFWRRGWSPLYSFLGGNPLAAMPSLHFATSLMAAHLLSDAGPVEGAIGWTYAATLGFALVYLGEHYVLDLLVGGALTESVRHLGPRAAPALRAFGRGVQALERAARP
jgi:hypothetical protein